MRPVVYKQDDYWTAALDHLSWIDRTDFETWDDAVDHALWLGWRAQAGRSG